MEIIIKKSTRMTPPLLGRLILWHHYKIGIGIWQIVAWIIGDFWLLHNWSITRNMVDINGFVMLLWVCSHQASWKVCLIAVGIEPATFGLLVHALPTEQQGQVSSSRQYFGTQSSPFDISMFLQSWISFVSDQKQKPETQKMNGLV